MSALSATQSITGVMHACSRRSPWRLRRRFVGSHVPGVPAQRLRGAEFCASDRHALLAVSHALVRTCADGLRPPVQAERLHLWRGAQPDAAGSDDPGRTQSRGPATACGARASLLKQRQHFAGPGVGICRHSPHGAWGNARSGHLQRREAPFQLGQHRYPLRSTADVARQRRGGGYLGQQQPDGTGPVELDAGLGIPVHQLAAAADPCRQSDHHRCASAARAGGHRLHHDSRSRLSGSRRVPRAVGPLAEQCGLYSSANPHVRGGAPYWRAAYQFSGGEHREHYYSVGTFGLDVKVRPDPSVPDTNRFTDLGFDAVYQYTDGGPGAILANASYIHEKQNLTATFNAGGSDNPTNHLNVFRLDASYAYRQTWSAGVGAFDTRGGTDRTF